MDFEPYKEMVRERIKRGAKPPLADELLDAYLDILKFRRVKKKQFLVQPGFPCKEQIYVLQGSLRAFFLDHEGKEQTFQFAIEDWYISDLRSHITGEPATIYVEALEDSLVALLPFTEFEALTDRYPRWQKIARVTAQRGFAYAQKRMIANLQKSAEDRYLEFIRSYPEIERRVPRHALASYLNMSQEYLSKIRKKLMEASS